MTLKNLNRNQTAVIVSVNKNPEKEGLFKRMTELGFAEGNAVRKVFISPLGGSCVYLVQGVLFALRDEEAGRIEAAPTEA